MPANLDQLITHDATEHCVACRAQEVVMRSLLPAAAAWEATEELPQFAVALHGAAGLLGTMLREGISRDDIEDVLSRLLDEMEAQIAEDTAMGGPPQGSA